MKSLFAVLALSLAGCSPDCVTGADIQLTLVPNVAVEVTRIAKLRLSLSVQGGAPRRLEITPLRAIKKDGSTLLLRPDPPPATRYNVSVGVEAVDAAGALIAHGSATGDVVAEGCNRLEVRLLPLPVFEFDAGAPDLAARDAGTEDLFTPPPDLPPNADLLCPSTPDEDGDGRGDACDLCPGDYDPNPVDDDMDGLPDACDPDPQKRGNQLLYFDPFNAASGHWSGGWQITAGEMQVETQAAGRLLAGNGVDQMPDGVRVQTVFFAPFFQGVGGDFESDVGIFLGNEAQTGTSTVGVLCRIQQVPMMPDKVDIDLIVGGSITQTVFTTFPFATDVLYRLRLTQRGGDYECEAATNGIPPASVTLTTNPPTTPQFVVLRANNVEAHFLSVVAESTVP